MDFLVDELWQDPPASARHQVHNAIRDLRAALAGSAGAGLITVDVGYRLDVPAGAVDAHRFTDGVRAARAARREGRDAEAMRLLQAAVDLWRGDAFDGIDCPSVTAAAAGLDEQRLSADSSATREPVSPAARPSWPCSTVPSATGSPVLPVWS
ncbi:BTAD domain-containing putative transcriptional regulator [Streptomyces sp. NE06-03E]|uniref:AfsR/SARP family transcriptional regulator n=1 Tax=Streptomyces sp. NE06-03E TaxID=3028695 RepID=UPI0029B3176B|nr:BTAD domain-containing putative transcriptional regulator [Streptomyces sp. NE06-03E]MDX3056891.1 BTAD domain-containing putative transcriptional regulator [Streptomyces sp. NE06-03E]